MRRVRRIRRDSQSTTRVGHSVPVGATLRDDSSMVGVSTQSLIGIAHGLFVSAEQAASDARVFAQRGMKVLELLRERVG